MLSGIVNYSQTLHLGDECVFRTMAITMAATYGWIQEFCPEIESIEACIERIELYFEADNIDADRQVAVFLSVIGGKNYTSCTTCCLQRSRVPRH